jgi:tRNA 2-thiocytidine biosynthesis protein TtcA
MMKTPEEIHAQKLFKKICRKTGTTMRDHNMVEEGDHVLVGISGGKDSMILLQALAERRSALPFDFKITAAHVEATGIGYRIEKDQLQNFCDIHNIPLHIIEIAPDFEKDPAKAPCFVCSWHRRKELFNLTRKLGCNKLALGHHRKDAVETLLLNMIYHGSISSLPYSLRMFDGRVWLIRPLMDVEESMLQEYADLQDLVRIEKSCPYEDRTRRQTIEGLIAQIESIHPPGPYNMFRSMGKIFEEYLPSSDKKN